MAKKKKQKKGGVAKRQLNKNQKRKSLKKKLHGQKPVQKKMTMSKVKKNLKNLALLIFEPELREIAFSKEAIAKAVKASDTLPEQIEAAADLPFMTKLATTMDLLEQRCESTKDTNKIIMIQAIQYYLKQENAPVFMNQIIVGMFLYGLEIYHDRPAPDSLEQINQLIKEYDSTWKEYLEERYNQYMEQKQDEEEETLPQTEYDGENETEEDEMLRSPYDDVLIKFEKAMENSAKNDDEIGRVLEDAEVFLNDYLVEKEVMSLNELKAKPVARFLEGWFVRNMNPTREDVENMFNSLDVFFDYAAQKNLISPETSREINKITGNKDQVLLNLGL